MATWTPILSPGSQTAEKASKAIDAITRAILTKDYEVSPQAKLRESGYDEALLYGYLALVHNDLHYANRAIEVLNAAIEEATLSRRYLGLFGGLCGLGWTIEHLSGVLQRVSGNDSERQIPEIDSDDDECEDLNAEIDSALLQDLDRSGAPRCYDLISGLVGFGVYFLERLPSPRALDGLNKIFYRLEEMAENTEDGGISWYTGPELLSQEQRLLCPRGYYNLGVAHGIPGIIYLLNELLKIDVVERDRVRRLLEGATSWLMAQPRPRRQQARFGSWVAPGAELLDSRLAWCYGDLGILAVLLQVVPNLSQNGSKELSAELLNYCLHWPADKTGVVDAPLCHGAAGIGHIFNRVYQSQGDPRCLNAAQSWLEQALAMRDPEKGVGGFSALTWPDPQGPRVLESKVNFLDGAIGIALALLAATTPVEPCWDRVLLLSAVRSNDLFDERNSPGSER